VRLVPWWVVLSSVCAPVLLIGGWRLAAARQPGGFDPARQTISELAARGATEPWIMTAALAGVGVCHMITAAGLAPAALPARVLLALGGAATIAVAALPLPAIGDSPAHFPGHVTGHAAAVSIAFTALSLWPAGGRGGLPGPALWRCAAAGLLGLLGWFGIDYFGQCPGIGRSERVLAGAQALWPLAVVLLALRQRNCRNGTDDDSPRPDRPR
jgi:hypothetical membrane protein